MATVGIFATWNYSFLRSAEEIFKKRLDKNPYYPFHEAAPNVFKYTVKSNSFLAGLALGVSLIVFMLVMYVNSPPDQWIVFPLLGLIFALLLMSYYWEERTFILYGNDRQYELYRGDKLVYRGHYHNIYIRLVAQKSHGGDTYYHVELNGYQVDKQVLTSTSTKMMKLRKLGRRLAGRLNLNYFDFMEKSRHHIIRHKCPYATVRRAERADLHLMQDLIQQLNARLNA